MRRTQAIAKRLRLPAVVAAAILAAVEGGILPPGLGLRRLTRRTNVRAESAGQDAPALRQARTPAATLNTYLRFRRRAHFLTVYPQGTAFGLPDARMRNSPRKRAEWGR